MKILESYRYFRDAKTIQDIKIHLDPHLAELHYLIIKRQK